jgi:hypothetical protein
MKNHTWLLACLALIAAGAIAEGVGSESVVQTGCAQARDAFEQCATQASNAPEGSARDQALEACQEAADQTTDALKASP